MYFTINFFNHPVHGNAILCTHNIVTFVSYSTPVSVAMENLIRALYKIWTVIPDTYQELLAWIVII